jgi:Pretoxin HINT domain
MKSIRPQNHLVHPDNGLVPIENLHGGTRALAIQIKAQASQTINTLITTANHPFWVAGEDWLAAVHLQPGHTLQLSDGSQASVYATGLVRRTQHADIGFAADDATGIGMVLSLSEGQVKPASDEEAHRLGKLELGEPYLTRVYNFEVDEFHTYYVGELGKQEQLGVWVHNTNCNVETTNAQAALREAITRSEAEARLRAEAEPCFAAGTLVHTKDGLKQIEDIKVGDLVLSYPDDVIPPSRSCEPYRLETEYYYKPVTQTFVHEDAEVRELQYAQSGREWKLRVTPNHPFYAEDRGWVQVKDLAILDRFLDADFANILCGGSKPVAKRERVHNLEVADFHTYFVGECGAWVHNKGNTPVLTPGTVDLATATTRTRLAEYSYKNNTTGTRPDTGRIGEFEAKYGMQAKTGIEFSTEARNASNNGADLIGFREADAANGVRGEVWVPEVKGSVLGRYPSVQYVGPRDNAIRWISEGKDGTLAGKPISAEAQALYARAYDLITNKGYTLVTGIVEVSVPRGGQSGRVVIDWNPNPNGYLSVETLGAGAASQLLELSAVSAVLPAARQYWLTAGATAAALSKATFQIADLSTGLAGQTQGSVITLEANGAGWGWFVDSTPADASEFASALSATAYQASGASEAAGMAARCALDH